MSIEYRPLLPAEESEFFTIVAHALTFDGPPSLHETFRQRIGAENLRAILRDGRIVGGLGVYRMGQWFGGRIVPSGGVCLVGIAPQARGEGAARFAVASLLQELAADGTPLACLYPSTQRLYRSTGFEQAGSWCRYRLPLSAINLTDRELPVSEVAATDVESLQAVATQRGRCTNGNLDRTSGLWQRITIHPQKPTYNGVIGPLDDPQGFICYRYEPAGDETVLHVTDMAATTPAAVRRLWTFLADHRSIPTAVSWCGPPTEPLLAVTEECRRTPVEMLRWMLRIIDVRGALEARGYPAHVRAEVHLDVTDELLSDNHGRFVLQVADGTGRVTEGGDGGLRMNIRGLAALYSSYLSPHALRLAGLVEGTDGALDAATQVFGGPAPWMPEIF